MLDFDTVTKQELAGALNQVAWCNNIINKFGNSKRLRCLRNDVEFVNIGLVGTPVIAGGSISSMGKTTGYTIHAPADLSTGTSILRIEGGTRWIQGTLGLSREAQLAAGVLPENVQAYDFTLPGNPSATTGIAFGSACKISAPKWMPSGTGPSAPPLTADSCVAFEMFDWTDPQNPVSVGIAEMDYRDADIVMDRPWLARELGDLRVMRCPDTGGVVFGPEGEQFLFAGTNLHMNSVGNSEANVPLQDLEIRAIPYKRWPNHPFMGGFDKLTDLTIPAPHKIHLLRPDGSIIDIIEDYASRDLNNTPGSGLPVNDPSWQSTNKGAKKIDFWWTCNMVHTWQSHIPKLTSIAHHLMPNIAPEAHSPRNVVGFAACQDCMPVFTGSNTFDGLNTWRLSPKWNGFMEFDTPIFDPYVNRTQAIRSNYITQVIGYGFKPGASGTHVWMTPPGGSRPDRAFWPTQVLSHIGNLDGIRPHGNVPFKDLGQHWVRNYANGNHHHFSNVIMGYGPDKKRLLAGGLGYVDTYYGAPDRPPNALNCVRLLGTGNGGSSSPTDKYGRRFYNTASRDYQHNQNSSALGVYIYRSPRCILDSAQSFSAAMLAASPLTLDFAFKEFLTREHAWHMGNFVNAWITATSDPRGFSTAEIETMWANHIHMVHAAVYPKYSTGTDLVSHTLRKLGQVYNTSKPTAATTKMSRTTDSKAFYMAQPLLLMKQSGAFAVMKAYSPKCAQVLDMIVDCLSKNAIGAFHDANGRPDRVFDSYPPDVIVNDAGPWPETYETMFPVNGELDWLKMPDGRYFRTDLEGALDKTNTMHLRAQALSVFDHYFREYTMPNLDSAIAKRDNFYAIVAHGQLNGITPRFSYRFVNFGLFEAPDYVGPPVI